MENRYIYLFPFEEIPRNAKILIYGAGDVGQEYLKQIKITGFCEVIGFIDRLYNKYRGLSVPIYGPHQVNDLQHDYIVLAMKSGMHIKEITDALLEKGIKKEKIIYIGSREKAFVLINRNVRQETDDIFAFSKAKLTISLQYSQGLGDCIVKKKLFDELVRLAPDCLIDIYTLNASSYIKAIYGDHPNLNLIIDDGGAIYEQNSNQYALSIKVFFMIQIDYINYDAIKDNSDLTERLMLLERRCREYKLTPYPITQNALHFKRQVYKKNNYYTCFAYDGVFDIKDTHVEIVLEQQLEYEFNKLELKKYITFNYGNGSSHLHEQLIAKQWPSQYFTQFVKEFKKNYPDIEIVQIGAENTKKIEGANRYILGESLELSKHILKNAIFHLDIEGGLVHLATQLGTKCIVLFGPTSVDFFGYKQNINLVSGKCSGCYCLYENINQCARNLKKPECMYSITPKMVMEAVKTIVEEKTH